MKKYWKFALLGSLAYLVFLIIMMPAAWWFRLLPLPAAIQHGPVTGTLWQGQIQQVQYQQLQLAELRWQLQPWSLLLLRAELQLDSGSMQQQHLPYLQAQLRLSPVAVEVRDALLRLPVPAVLPLLELPLPVQAEGNLLFDVSRLVIREQQCHELTGSASWLDARLQPPTGTWLNLEHFHASLRCENNQPLLTTDPANILALAIDATVNQQGQLTVSGTLQPSAQLPDEVHQAMRFVGTPDAQGRYRLNF